MTEDFINFNVDGDDSRTKKNLKYFNIILLHSLHIPSDYFGIKICDTVPLIINISYSFKSQDRQTTIHMRE